MTAAQQLESDEQEAWQTYLDHARGCADCAAWYAFCEIAAGLLSRVRDLRDEIGRGPR